MVSPGENGGSSVHLVNVGRFGRFDERVDGIDKDVGEGSGSRRERQNATCNGEEGDGKSSDLDAGDQARKREQMSEPII